MEIGTRSFQTATLTVAVPSAVPPHMQAGMRELLAVHTPVEDRRQGYATALMREVCEEADRERKVLLLQPKQLGDLTQAELIAWYQRFGFECLPAVVEGAEVLMARRVRVEQAVSAPSLVRAKLPPALEVAQSRIGALRKSGIPLQQAVRQALAEAAASRHQ